MCSSDLTRSRQALKLPHRAPGIEKKQADRPLQDNKAFETGPGPAAQVPVRPHIGARLHGIEKTLHRISLLMEVVVATQTGQQAGFGRHLIEQRLVEALDLD